MRRQSRNCVISSSRFDARIQTSLSLCGLSGAGTKIVCSDENFSLKRVCHVKEMSLQPITASCPYSLSPCLDRIIIYRDTISILTGAACPKSRVLVQDPVKL